MELMATLKSLISFFSAVFSSATQFRRKMGDGCGCVYLKVYVDTLCLQTLMTFESEEGKDDDV